MKIKSIMTALRSCAAVLALCLCSSVANSQMTNSAPAIKTIVVPLTAAQFQATLNGLTNAPPTNVVSIIILNTGSQPRAIIHYKQ